MKVISINACTFGSTGKIMFDISKKLRENNITAYTASPRGRSQIKITDGTHIYIGNILSRNIHILLAKITGYHGCFSILSTLRFLNKIKKINPDIIHLHNLHGDYINIPLLFKYIKKRKIKIIWTLHDCWAFTGHCPHYYSINCNKWKEGCCKCPNYKSYPSSFTDSSRMMWNLKKKYFTNIEDLTIVTPSNWLAKEVKQSFLSKSKIIVINNGIDLSIFKPTKSNIKEKLNIHKDKFIILGVAYGWSNKKGLDVFIELSKIIDDKYKIVLVGTNDTIDKLLPDNIISIHRTANLQELVKIYSIADIFLNPTKEEVLGLVNIEALACGTPVLTFNTGGSPECISKKCGMVIENNIEIIKKEIERIIEQKIFNSRECILHATNYDKQAKYQEYLEIYLDNKVK